MLPFFPLWGRPSQWPLLFVFFLNVASIFGIRESVQSLFPTDRERITQYINQDLLHAWILKLNYRNEGFFPQAMEFITSRNEGNFMGKLKYLTSKGKSPQKGNMTWFNYRVNRKIVSQISHWVTEVRTIACQLTANCNNFSDDTALLNSSIASSHVLTLKNLTMASWRGLRDFTSEAANFISSKLNSQVAT